MVIVVNEEVLVVDRVLVLVLLDEDFEEEVLVVDRVVVLVLLREEVVVTGVAIQVQALENLDAP